MCDLLTSLAPKLFFLLHVHIKLLEYKIKNVLTNKIGTPQLEVYALYNIEIFLI